MNMTSKFKNFWRDDRGQSTTEYILILSVVVMIAIKFKAKFGDVMKQSVDQLDGKLKDAMKDDS